MYYNLNYLGIINNIQSTNELKISDRTRLESKKRTNDENRKFFDGKSGMKYGVEVSFAENQEEPIIEQKGYRAEDEKIRDDENDTDDGMCAGVAFCSRSAAGYGSEQPDESDGWNNQ